MGWKYVIIKKGIQEIPIIFPDVLVHADVALAIREIWVDNALEMIAELGASEETLAHRTKDLYDALLVVSAGTIGTLVVRDAGGHSETLDVASRPGDGRLINTFPYAHGIKSDADD